MPTQERRLKQTIMTEYSAVWDVAFQHGATVVVVISANPAQTLCLVKLSRLIADLYRASYYTIDVQYHWNPCRLRVLLENNLKGPT